MLKSRHWEKFLSTVNYNKLTSEQVGAKYVQWLTTIPVVEVPPDYYWDYLGLNWWEKPKKMVFYIPSKPSRSCPYLRFEQWVFWLMIVFRRGFHSPLLPSNK